MILMLKHFIQFQEIEANQDDKEEILKELLLVLLSACKFQECQEIIQRLIKLNHDATFGLYILAHLMMQHEQIDVSILILKILVRLQPLNLEFWILLKMMFSTQGCKFGSDYCTIQMFEAKFISNDDDSSLFPDVEFDDEVEQILSQQLKFKLMKYVELTKEFISSQAPKREQNIYLQQAELVIEEKFDDAMKSIGEIEPSDENEMQLRIMKGNVLFALGERWKGICEYEVAYNLCLMSDKAFPNLPAIRCGQWFLEDKKSLAKSRRYFHHCCQASSTFNSWMGLGAVSFHEGDFHEAEKCFAEANKIDQKSGDNWIYLALVNFHLQRFDNFQKYFYISRKFPVLNVTLLDEAEKIIDL